MVKSIFSITLLGMIVLFSGCGIYSFTGAETDAKTMQVDFFTNKASNAPAGLDQSFTDALKEKFARQTNLSSVSNSGDLHLSGYISSYNVTAIAPTANETSGLTRLTITVNVDFENALDPKDKWSQSFSQFADFPGEEDLSAVEGTLIDEINDKLTDAIFVKALVRW